MTIDAKPLPAIASDGLPWRLAAFGIATFALYQLLYLLLQGEHGVTLSAENGPVETLEGLLAVAASVLFFVAAGRTASGRSAMTVFGCAIGYAAARESDALMEHWLFDDAYKYLVGLPLAVLAVGVIYHHRSRFVRESLWLVQQPAAVLYIIAGIYLGGVCQIFDRPDLWKGIASASEAMATKATIEEFAELFAYLLFAFSAAETFILARRTQLAAINAAVRPLITEVSLAGGIAAVSEPIGESPASRTVPRRRVA